MCAKAYILQVVGNSRRHLFQFNQVKVLMGRLMKREDIFRSLTDFPGSLLNTQDYKKRMPKLLMILLSRLPGKDKVKDRWGKDLMMVITKEEWNRIKKLSGALLT